MGHADRANRQLLRSPQSAHRDQHAPPRRRRSAGRRDPVGEAVPAARRADVIDAICRANNAIPLPGFGYHYDLHFVYMRLCVPMYEEGMLSTSFRKQLASVVSNAREFAVPFMKIVQGEPGERILELAVAAAAASSS